MDALAVDQLLPVTATEIASWAIAIIAVAIVVVGGIVLLVSRRRTARRAQQAGAGDDAAQPDGEAPSGGTSDA